MLRLLVIAGTRPEAIKLCPLVVHANKHMTEIDIRVCATGQHREMLDGALAIFGVRPDYDLNVMQAGQTVCQTASRILALLEPVVKTAKPDFLLVQGDTTTTLAGALCGFYSGVPVAHVEAGLRTGNMAAPFPEEMNRVLTTRLSTLHFAATPDAAQNLLREGVPDSRIAVTGNTGIDAVLHVRDQIAARGVRSIPLDGMQPDRKLILVTAHRRESFGAPLERICRSLRTLAARQDVFIVMPVHPNPEVSGRVRASLAGAANVQLTEPLDYTTFVALMMRAHLIITDSGGIQEEAPSLGVPVLVMRESTERPEAVQAGAAVLTGADESRIVFEAERLLDDAEEYGRRARVRQCYGDGRASERILNAIRDYAAQRRSGVSSVSVTSPPQS